MTTTNPADTAHTWISRRVDYRTDSGSEGQHIYIATRVAIPGLDVTVDHEIGRITRCPEGVVLARFCGANDPDDPLTTARGQTRPGMVSLGRFDTPESTTEQDINRAHRAICAVLVASDIAHSLR